MGVSVTVHGVEQSNTQTVAIICHVAATDKPAPRFIKRFLLATCDLSCRDANFRAALCAVFKAFKRWITCSTVSMAFEQGLERKRSTAEQRLVL